MAQETLKGQVAAISLGMYCAIRSRGEINFATPFVDDQGIDLVLFRKGGAGKVILVQVKSRTTESKKVEQGTFRTQVRRQAFHPREGYFLIFTSLDVSTLQLRDCAWVVPSLDFQEKLKGQSSPKFLVFQSRFNSNDMWKTYRLNLNDLPDKISQLLNQ